MLQEWKSLGDKLSCLGATNTVLNAEVSMKEVKRRILKVDWDTCLSTASQRDRTAVAAKISSIVSWMKLWDRPLDHGPRGTNGLASAISCAHQANVWAECLFNLLYPTRGNLL